MSQAASGVVSVPVRWVDLDAQGHVNNALVVDYLQEARVAFLLNGPNAHLLGDGVIVVGHQVEYLSAIGLAREPLRVELRLGQVGASLFSFGYEVFQDDTRVARARTRACVFDFDLGRPVRMKPEERAWFSSYSQKLEPFAELGRWRVGDDAHEFAFPVRWSDLDSYGHVNNTRFFDYVAEARVALTEELEAHSIGFTQDEDADHAWLVARQDLDYVGQLEHRLEPYLVRTGVAKIGRTSMTFVAEIVDPLDFQLASRSVTVVVYAGRDGRPKPIPDAARAQLTKWQAVER